MFECPVLRQSSAIFGVADTLSDPLSQDLIDPLSQDPIHS